MAQMQQRFGQKLALSTFFQGATIEQLAAVLHRALPSLSHSPLVGIHLSGARPPFFCVHPAGGSVLCYVDLARRLGPNQPFYGLQHPGIDGEAMPDMCIEDMAQHYIQALRACQPEGPYLLGGWSMGGMVAFEMAQQLVVQGQKVALLALLDTHAMPAEMSQTDVSHATLLHRFAQDLGLSLDPMHLATHPPEAQMAEILAQARAAQVVPAEVGLPELHRRIQVYLNNAHAMRRYTSNTYAGHITLLKARDRTVGQDPTLGWGEVATGGVMVRTVPGNHYTMLQQPHVQTLAQQLSQCLATAQTR
jgi:thioesterase domain-containing protein